MKTKRIIPCLDIKNGRVVKGVKFKDFTDVASPPERAKIYCDNGADELVFYDITASIEGRGLFADLLKQVAESINIPLTAGGGISTIKDVDVALECGAVKVSINTGALKNPQLLSEAAKKYGSQSVMLAIDAKLVDGVYRIFTQGGMENSGIDAIEWIKRGADLGAGELVVNSIDADGVRQGFDLKMLEAVLNAVDIPVIASGGAGSIDDFITLFKTLPEIDAGLGASVFHFGLVDIRELKQALLDNGISVRV